MNGPSMRTLVVIVTYNPDAATLRLIHSCLGQPSSVMVVDNGSRPSPVMDEIASTAELIFRKLDRNHGLALAQNVGIRHAQNAQYDRIMFLDQDTDIPETFISDMNGEFNRLTDAGNRVGILGPNYFDRNTNEDAHFARLTKRGYTDVTLTGNDASEVSFIISSGSMMNVSLFQQTGYFVEEFFIDQVDTEFCLRVASHGLKVFATPRVKITHTIGNRTKHKLLFLTIKPNHHKAFRKFFIVRNGIKAMMIYRRRFPGFVQLMCFRLIHDLLAVLFHEQDKWAKLRSMWQGLKQATRPYNEWDNRPG